MKCFPICLHLVLKRINQTYGTDWNPRIQQYNGVVKKPCTTKHAPSSLTFTCPARVTMKKRSKETINPEMLHFISTCVSNQHRRDQTGFPKLNQNPVWRRLLLNVWTGTLFPSLPLLHFLPCRDLLMNAARYNNDGREQKRHLLMQGLIDSF